MDKSLIQKLNALGLDKSGFRRIGTEAAARIEELTRALEIADKSLSAFSFNRDAWPDIAAAKDAVRAALKGAK